MCVYATFGKHGIPDWLLWVFCGLSISMFGVSAALVNQGLLVSVFLIVLGSGGAAMCLARTSLKIDLQEKQVVSASSSPLYVLNSKKVFRFERFDTIAAISLEGDGECTLIFYAMPKSGNGVLRTRSILSMSFHACDAHLIEPLVSEIGHLTGWKHVYKKLGAIDFFRFRLGLATL